MKIFIVVVLSMFSTAGFASTVFCEAFLVPKSGPAQELKTFSFDSTDTQPVPAVFINDIVPSLAAMCGFTYQGQRVGCLFMHNPGWQYLTSGTILNAKIGFNLTVEEYQYSRQAGFDRAKINCVVR